tara:strand:- start:349 stop:606 length:258 start_codon:yes stop_codon:yes gene_type:complete
MSDTMKLKNEYRDEMEAKIKADAEAQAEKPAVEVENVVRYLNDVAGAMSHIQSGIQQTISRLNHQAFNHTSEMNKENNEGEKNDD